jgi:hypothetical protein
MVPATGSNQTAFAASTTNLFSYNPGTGLFTVGRFGTGSTTLGVYSISSGDANVRLASSGTGHGKIYVTTNDFMVFTNEINRFVVAANGNVQAINSIGVNANNNPTAIENLGTNGVGNIGTSAKQFNTLFAKANQALYADLAEKYLADTNYEPGTVLVFGGSKEVTISQNIMSTSVAGVVSTDPAYLMNSGLNGENVAIIALQGRVPTKVVGPVGKGDMLVTAPNGYATACSNPVVGSLIGKSLENFTATEENPTAVIEVVVGRS